MRKMNINILKMRRIRISLKIRDSKIIEFLKQNDADLIECTFHLDDFVYEKCKKDPYFVSPDRINFGKTVSLQYFCEEKNYSNLMPIFYGMNLHESKNCDDVIKNIRMIFPDFSLYHKGEQELWKKAPDLSFTEIRHLLKLYSNTHIYVYSRFVIQLPSIMVDPCRYIEVIGDIRNTWEKEYFAQKLAHILIDRGNLEIALKCLTGFVSDYSNILRTGIVNNLIDNWGYSQLSGNSAEDLIIELAKIIREN